MIAWERDTIREIRSGNPGAYARIVDEYQGPIRHCVQRIVGDRECARDVTQDAFLAAFQHLDRFDETRSFYNWLCRIACNRAISTRRRERRVRPLYLDELPALGPNPEDLYVALETARSVRRAVAHLPRKYLHVLLLRHYGEYGYAEIARRLHVPRSTVRSRLHTARRLVAHRLQGS